MSVVLVGEKITKRDIDQALIDYKVYIKVTIDIETGKMAIGGEWHADGEKKLLGEGSKKINIWGGGIELKTKKIDVNALINVKPGLNESMEIIDKEVRKRFEKLIREKFSILVEE